MPAADASVRRARSSDVPAIAAVQARAWRQAYAGLLPEQVVAQLAPERFVAAWRAEIGASGEQAAGSAVFVALSGATVVGAASVRPGGELATLVVDPDRQRQGHGSRLLSAAADTLREAGVAEVHAWAPSADEARLRFLTSAGLQPDGVQRVLRSDDGGEVVEIRLHAVLT